MRRLNKEQIRHIRQNVLYESYLMMQTMNTSEICEAFQLIERQFRHDKAAMCEISIIFTLAYDAARGKGRAFIRPCGNANVCFDKFIDYSIKHAEKGR